MDAGLYNKSLMCPVCSKKIEVTKVKMDAAKSTSKDSDFCVYFENINPMFYDIWVCEHCGYAAQAERFESIRPAERKIISDSITPKWRPRSFSGERTIETALDTYKLVLYTLQLINGKSSDKARICHRIAWIFRFLGNEEKEKEFLGFALDNYKEAFEKENFPIGKMDEYTFMYLIGELNRRLGNLDEAVVWYSKVIGSQGARFNKQLMDLVREQNDLVKSQIKQEKTE